MDGTTEGTAADFSEPDLDLVKDRLHLAAADLTERGGTLSFGIVFRDGAESFNHPKRPFRIASMTKSFVAALFGSLVANGLDLDYPLGWLVPDLRGTAVADLTCRQCLTMGTGFGKDDPWADRMESMSRFDFLTWLQSDLIPIADPDTGFEYCNLGYALLGLVAEAVSDRPLAKMLRTEVTGPLAMSATTFDIARVRHLAPGLRIGRGGKVHRLQPTGPGAFSPIGGLISTASDIGTWMRTHMDALDPEIRHRPGVWSQALSTNQDPHRAVATETSEFHTEVVSYGFGLMHRKDSRFGRVICHSGGYPGYGSHMRWYPDLGFGIVALANTTYYPAERVVRDAVDAGWLEATGRRAMIPSRRGDSPSTSGVPVIPRASVAAPREVHPADASTGRTVLAAANLVCTFDDDFAATRFSVNMDLDEPREERRSHFDRWRRDHGLSRDDRFAVDDLTMNTRLLGTVRVPDPLSPTAASRAQNDGSAAITVRLDHLGDVQSITLSD